MTIAPFGMAATLPASAAAAATANDAAAQFDAMFYRLMLQTVQWMPAGAGGSGMAQSLFGGMLNDFFAQEAARQQSAFGAMLLTIDGQGRM